MFSRHWKILPWIGCVNIYTSTCQKSSWIRLSLHGFGKVSTEVGLRFHFWPLAMVDIDRSIKKSVLFVALQFDSRVLVVVPKYQCWLVAC